MATRSFGSGASSLLRSAQSAQARQNTYQDAVQSYIYELSPKTQADFQKYNQYLSDRAGKEIDPSKQLALQRTQTSAYRSFNSNEISRATTQVLYGNISDPQKYQQMIGLYQNALGNGDEQLAQTIQAQLANLDIKIQGEQAAAQGGSGRGGGGGGGGSSGLTKAYNADLAPHLDAEKALSAELKDGKISPNDYAYQLNQVYANQKAVIENGLNQGIDKATTDQLNLQNNDKYRQISSPIFQEKLSRPQGAEQPFAAKVDEFGNIKLVARTKNALDNPIGIIPGTDKTAEQSKYNSGLLKSATPGNMGTYETFRTLSTQPGSQKGYVQTDQEALNQQTGLQQYLDPITHKVLNIDTKNSVAHYLANPDPKAGDAPALQQTSVGLAKSGGVAPNILPGETLKDVLLGDFNQPLGQTLSGVESGAKVAANDLAHFGNTALNLTGAGLHLIRGNQPPQHPGGFFGGALNTIGRIADIGKIKEAAAQAAAAQAAARASALQAQQRAAQQASQQAQQAAQQAAQFRNNPQPASKQYQAFYGAGPIAQSITQKAPAVVPLINKLTGFGNQLKF